MKPIGQLFGASFWMRYEDPPVIVVRWRMRQENGDALAIHGLVHALGGAGTIQRRPDGWMQAEIVYDGDFDNTIVELIDLLIDLRMEHPTMVQLPLQLSETERENMEAALNG